MKTLKKPLLFGMLFLSILLIAFGINGIISETKPISVHALDESTAVVKETNGETVNYYSSFSDAVGNCARNSTLTLLQDADLCSFNNKTITIDINGKTASGDITVSYSTITITDSVGTGTITGYHTYRGSSSIITVENVKFTTNELFSIFLSDFVKLNVKSGYIKRLGVNSYTTISGGEIDTLTIYDVSKIKNNISDAKINKFDFQCAPDYAIIKEGYKYTRVDNGKSVKISDMTPDTSVNVVPCKHIVNDFENYVCKYCGYVCNHQGQFDTEGVCKICGYICDHQGLFNTDGVCTKCGYVCKHTDFNDEHVCNDCGNEIIAKISGSSDSHHIDFNDAVSALKDGDVLTFYRDVSFDEEPRKFTASCTIDLNGCSINDYYLNLQNTTTVIDTKGGGFICVSGSGNVSIRASETTNIMVMTLGDNFKVYSGKILGLTVYNVSKNSVLPDENIFVLHNGTESKILTRTESASLSNLNYGEYLTVEQCSHDRVNAERLCVYCDKELTNEECITALLKEIESNKTELNDLIDKKASVDLLNEKVSALNDLISSAETSIKSYADDNDGVLKSQLETKIGEEKQSVISYADSILETLESELTDLIDKKASVDLLNEKVSALNSAISNAETLIKSYADDNDGVLKNQLETKIGDAKQTLQTAIDEINTRLTVAEKKIDENNEKINSLSTALTVISIILFIVMAGGFAGVFVFIRKTIKKQ